MEGSGGAEEGVEVFPADEVGCDLENQLAGKEGERASGFAHCSVRGKERVHGEKMGCVW